MAPLVVSFAEPRLRAPLLVIVATLTLITVEGIYTHALQGAQRYDITARTSTIKMALQLVIAVIAIQAGAGLATLLAAMGLTLAISCWWQRRRVHDVYRAGLDAPPAAMTPDVRAYLLPLSIVAVLDAIVWDRSPVFFLGLYATSEDIAYYSLAFGLATRIMVVPGIVAGALLPALSALHGSGAPEEFVHVYHSALRYVALVGAPLAALMAALGPGVITWLYGDAYLPAAPLLGAMAGVALLAALRGVVWTALRAVGDRSCALTATAVAAVVNLGAGGRARPALDHHGRGDRHHRRPAHRDHLGRRRHAADAPHGPAGDGPRQGRGRRRAHAGRRLVAGRRLPPSGPPGGGRRRRARRLPSRLRRGPPGGPARVGLHHHLHPPAARDARLRRSFLRSLMRILVTGGAGFIGSTLVDACLAQGHDVAVVDDLSSGAATNVASAARFYEVDVRTRAFDEVLATERPELISHHAAQVSVRRSVDEPVLDAEINVLGTLNVLEAARRHGVRRVVFASTGGAIYGEPDAPRADETHPRRPQSPYAIAKLAAEHYLEGYRRSRAGGGGAALRQRVRPAPGPARRGRRGGDLHPAHPGRTDADASSATASRCATSSTWTTSCAPTCSPTQVALDGIAEPVFNVGTGHGTSVNALWAALAKIAQPAVSPSHEPARTGDLVRSVLDATRARTTLGWEPRVDIATGLARTWDWFEARARRDRLAA